MTVRWIIDDVMAGLRTLPDASVHCCVTSPPYFGLRDYGTGRWDGGSADCDHVSHEIRTGSGMEALGEKYAGGGKKASLPKPVQFADVCGKCGATRVDHQIGLEKTPAEFIAKLVEVFGEVWRVLRDDGTVWINIGDSYANDGKWGGASGGKHVTALHGASGVGRGKKATGLKPKDLIGIPWRLAFALQDAGWYLRQDIIWSKPNPMPESVKDRCTKAHEYIFLLTKQPRYFFDHESIKETSLWPDGPNSPDSITSPYVQGFARRASMVDERARPPNSRPHKGIGSCIGAKGNARGFRGGSYVDGEPGKRQAVGNQENETASRNKRSVWTMATVPFPDAHFATFPPELPELCIKAGCPASGTVLDPFGGAGTTGVVADRLGRNAVLIELNPEYAKIGKRRISRDRLERKAGTMDDVATAELPPTPLEAIIAGAAE